MTVERELDKADIDALWALPDGGLEAATPPRLKMRHRHHELARLIAGGTSETDASYITGYAASSISILKQDPAFKELLSYYKEQKEALFVDFFERLRMLSIHTADELMDRLESTPEDFSIEDLSNILTLAADRTGFGPTKSVDFKGTLGLVNAEALARIKQEVSNRQNGQIKRLDSKDHRLEVGGAVIEKSLAEEAEIIPDTENGDKL